MKDLVGRFELQFLDGNLLVYFRTVDCRGSSQLRIFCDTPDEVRLSFQPERRGLVCKFALELETRRVVDCIVGQASEVSQRNHAAPSDLIGQELIRNCVRRTAGDARGAGDAKPQ